jgi:hypothetical protein
MPLDGPVSVDLFMTLSTLLTPTLDVPSGAYTTEVLIVLLPHLSSITASIVVSTLLNTTMDAKGRLPDLLASTWLPPAVYYSLEHGDSEIYYKTWGFAIYRTSYYRLDVTDMQ